jgi:hypothetical protein
MSKKLSSPSESLFAEAAAERAEDGSAEDCRIFPVWPFCVNVNTSDAISGMKRSMELGHVFPVTFDAAVRGIGGMPDR